MKKKTWLSILLSAFWQTPSNKRVPWIQFTLFRFQLVLPARSPADEYPR